MKYEEKIFNEVIESLNFSGEDKQRWRVMMLMYDGFRLLKAIRQQQQQLDLHLFQETLKEHGIGGIQYDAIITRVKEAITETVNENE